MSGAETNKKCVEVINGQKVDRAPMFFARSNFGCAVYPNYS